MDLPTATAAKSLTQATHSVMEAVQPHATKLSRVAAIRNATFDTMYYDLLALTAEEISMLSRNLLAQGTVLIVQPNEGAGGISMSTARDFVNRQMISNAPIKTLVVPGVGSSALGAAALGRNVADALHEPVAAIVSGYGAADLFADACGGWYVLGTNNLLLDMAAHNEAIGLKSNAAVSNAAAGATHGSVVAADTDWFSPLGVMLNEASDVNVLRNIFSSPNGIRLLVGHSKGCLAMAFALHDIALREGAKKLPQFLHAITIGCVTNFPSGVKASQFLGTHDALGHANSRWWLPRTYLLGKTHSLNRLCPLFVKVSRVLELAELSTIAS